MKTVNIRIGNVDTCVTVVPSKSKKTVLSKSDIEMDRRAEHAVKAAIKRAEVCRKPVARYNSTSKRVSVK